ncbi:MAG: 3-deoxy-D-manno-octulosonic acid transferase [Pseudomonadota bacterium]
MTALLRAYAALAPIALHFVVRRERRKLTEAGMADRLPEKLGQTGLVRPKGKLLWVHAASVGESLSALALIVRLAERCNILVTTGTATSAKLMAQRLPSAVQHQFAPLDAPAPVTRFLDHWKPDACLLVESELWPNTLSALHKRGTPTALVNARLSDTSLERWEKRRDSARELLEPFKLILTQTKKLAGALHNLGAPVTRAAQNLKSMAPPLPSDEALIALVPPKSWVAASTHPGEEEIILNAHAILLEHHPDLTLILVPRHPERGDDVAQLIEKRRWPAPRRSLGKGPDGPVWLVDTLGELGSLYKASPITFLGGSLVPVGGHNPYEPAQAGAAVISGPHVENFTDAFAEFHVSSAAQSVGNAQDLANKVGNLLSHPPLMHVRQEAARKVAAAQSQGLEEIESDLARALDL